MELRDGRIRKHREAWDKLGHAHELTFTCYHRLKMLSRDRTRQWFVETIDRARKKLGFEVWAYVIMPDHAHVLVYPKSEECKIGRVLHAIKQPVAIKAIRWLRANAPAHLERLRHELPSGEVQHRFWQVGGGYDRNMWSADAIWNGIRYLHRNPIRAGLVENPKDWKWSSAAWYQGEREVPLLMDRRPPVRREVKFF